MKATELRVNNLIKIEDEIYRVQSIYITGELGVMRFGVFYYRTIDHSKPIPLTEEWLIKFGFVYAEGYYVLGDINFSMDRNKKWYLSIDGRWYGDKIEYVHQLQNLIFALTGEELTI